MQNADFRTALVELEPSLTRYARSLTPNAEDALDLLQETYLRALTFQDSFQENTNLKAWAFTIMRNTFINNYRRLSRKNTKFDETADQRLLNTQTDEIGADAKVATGEIFRAIASLSDEFRIPFEMHTSGYKYREIADELDLCIGTVKSRIYFSRQKLMQQLPGYRD
ncbi:MAG: RNA polymerase subunit sigma [Bacteroidetes bacterium]|nr:MAG: RNA polymerase subunit sigma [Bacteroidota bacterium]